MKIEIFLCVLVTTVFSHDVYHFEIPHSKQIKGGTFCDNDKKYQCPETKTCCPTGLADPDKFRCCDLEKANCCNNGKACCPESYVCSSDSQTCYPNVLGMILRKSISRPTILNHEDKLKQTDIRPNSQKTCPDGQSQCADYHTCCLLSNGTWGCCPLANAVCCSDHLHCCPQGTTCDLVDQTCNSGNRYHSALVKKVPSKKVSSVVCPDGQSQCEDGSTCCLLSDGTWGCCPMVNAVCCSDHLHCCPQGTTCDLVDQTCKSGNRYHSALVKKVQSKKVSSFTCPDGKTTCNDGETCCQLGKNYYGCCSYTK